MGNRARSAHDLEQIAVRVAAFEGTRAVGIVVKRGLGSGRIGEPPGQGVEIVIGQMEIHRSARGPVAAALAGDVERQRQTAQIELGPAVLGRLGDRSGIKKRGIKRHRPAEIVYGYLH